MKWQRDEYLISTDKTEMDVAYIHQFLSEQSYWAQGIPYDTVERSIAHSLCFGVYHHQKQIGFARIITDYATFGYLADVFVDVAYRGKGLSKWLIQIVMEYPALQGLRRIMLGTRDAQGLYAQFGFIHPTNPAEIMHIRMPDVYKKTITSNK